MKGTKHHCLAGGDRVIWEHLGMMHDDEYVRGWNWKLEWYHKNGYVLGQKLFISEERRGEGLKMDVFRCILQRIMS